MNTTQTGCTLNGAPIDCPNIGLMVGTVGLIFALIILINIIAFWKIFTKAGKPGWASIIPVYNMVVMLEIAKKPIWWVILMFIPVVNVVVGIVLTIELAKAFGKEVGFTIGLVILPIIFFPIMAFDDSKYIYGDTPEVPPMPDTNPIIPPAATV
ncbi:MAG: DUF5684 domain-containing protein [Patescibacteria group bacterium]